MKNESQCGYTQGPMHIELTTRGTTEQVQTKTQEILMEEGEGKDTGMDAQILESYEPSEAQRKRTREQERGSRNKVKAHKKPMDTSLMTDDVDLIAMTMEDRLLEMWENVENHRDSILEKIQEVKNVLE
jgi:hypothetical protein